MSFPIPDETACSAAEQDAACSRNASARLRPSPCRRDSTGIRLWNAAGRLPHWGRGDAGAIRLPDGRDVANEDQEDHQRMRSEHVRYVVRDQYLEPYKGHDAEHGMRALATNRGWDGLPSSRSIA